MEENKGFRLKLNLFDGIVILAALAVGAVLLYMNLKPAAPAGDTSTPAAATTQYTIRLQKTLPGTGELIEAGDALVDVVKNFELGTVVSATVMPATDSIINEEAKAYVTAEIPGYEDIEIVVESSVTYGEENILVGSGYKLRVGEKIYVRGPGYLGSGEVYAIERGN
ncbi:MAG: DUF4330 domain-containing protein [Oscillibacter sp.]|jgi:hypothetical protein|nr:DUF4330 domain-containing protein [Oscillibacter sp.]